MFHDELMTNCEHRLTASILHLDSMPHFMSLDWAKIKIWSTVSGWGGSSVDTCIACTRSGLVPQTS